MTCELIGVAYIARTTETRTSCQWRLDHPPQCVPPPCIPCLLLPYCSVYRWTDFRIQLTCKFIAHNIRRATLINLLGLAGASNATGDDQKKLDVLGNQIFLDTMKNCGKVGVIVSEEEEEAIIIKTKGARYAVVCDPIDGTYPLP